MKRKTVLLVLAAAAAAAALCTTAMASEGKETMVIADNEWYGTDMYQNDSWSGVQTLIADTLFTIDPETGALTDGICTDLQTSEDGLTMTMTVPEGKFYATGEQVEPEDIVASIEYGKEVSPYADGYSNIESMEVDGRNVIFHLTSFRSDMLYYLGECFMGVIDKDQLDSMSTDELMWGAVPYGQYYVSDYITGSEVTLLPNEGYVTDNPYVENKGVGQVSEIIVRFDVDNAEEFTYLEELKNEDIDFINGISMDGKAELESAENVVIQDKTYPNIEYFELNTDGTIFEDIEVRKAVALAINRDELIALTDGAAGPAYSMIYDSVQNFSQEAKDYFMENYANDPEKAAQILADAGYEDTDGDGYLEKDGEMLEFTFYARSSGTSVTIAQGLQSQMKKLGIMMNIETIDWNYIYENINNDEYDAGIEVLEWAEPMLVLNCCYYDQNAIGNDDDYYAAVEDAATTVDNEERTKKIGDIQTAMFDNVNIIPFYSDLSYIAYGSWVKGVNVLSNGTLYYNDITF